MHYIHLPVFTYTPNKTFNDITEFLHQSEEDSHEPLLLNDVIELHPLFCFIGHTSDI